MKSKTKHKKKNHVDHIYTWQQCRKKNVCQNLIIVIQEQNDIHLLSINQLTLETMNSKHEESEII